uniref:TonB C-terminal domain-containing protein n=1 Tax=mine drainage metagenome TaxID=410659 RepID=E6Q4D0_9ZZZZ
MKRLRPVAATLAFAVLAAMGALPARAQYTSEFSPAKLIKQGTATTPWAGPGLVVLQVEVFPNGTFHVMKVIRTTNAGDVAAALEIAKTSTYMPAHRGSKPIQAFYDYTLKFGKRLVRSGEQGMGGGKLGHIDALIHAGKYADAKQAAATYLLAHPGNALALQYLGIADYFSSDYPSAVKAFDKVKTIGAPFKVAAAQAFAAVAVLRSSTDPDQALLYAQKSYALDSSPNSLYALGLAEFGMKHYARSIASLEKARGMLFAQKNTPTATKVAVDSHLLQGYLQTGDTTNSNAMLAELKALDPTGTTGAEFVGAFYLQQGVAAAKAHKPVEALAALDKAASAGDPKISETAYTQAAFVIIQSSAPDYNRVRSYAKKALAIDPNDPVALFASGIGEAGLATDFHRADLTDRAKTTLNKALAIAKAGKNAALVLQIQNFLKHLGG